MLADSLAYLDSLISLRKGYLKLTTAGRERTVYHACVQGFSEIVTALLSHIQSFQLLGEQGTIENLSPTPYPATVFASKGRHEIELIKKICQCRMHTIPTYLVHINQHTSPICSNY